jgi:hypothetical protein
MAPRLLVLLLTAACLAASSTSAAAASPKPCRWVSAKTVTHGSWWRGGHPFWWRTRWARGPLRRCVRPRAVLTDVKPNLGKPPIDGPVPRTPVSTPQDPLGHSVQVRALEFSLTLSRTAVAAGDVNVEFNTVYAEDPHDLHLRDSAGNERTLFSETAAELLPPPRKPFPIAAGDYVLFCALPGHEALGMSAPLQVR